MGNLFGKQVWSFNMAQIHFRDVDEKESFLTIYRQIKINNSQTQFFSLFIDANNPAKMIETFWENQGTALELVHYITMIFNQIKLRNPSYNEPIIYRP